MCVCPFVQTGSHRSFLAFKHNRSSSGRPRSQESLAKRHRCIVERKNHPQHAKNCQQLQNSAKQNQTGPSIAGAPSYLIQNDKKDICICGFILYVIC